MVRDRGFEPLTPSVSRKCSTTELTAHPSWQTETMFRGLSQFLQGGNIIPFPPCRKLKRFERIRLRTQCITEGNEGKEERRRKLSSFPGVISSKRRKFFVNFVCLV
jgi:hypothetical protein